jgi:hypothetical protein
MMTKAELPSFCLKEFRPMIVEKFQIHLHQHPQIPFNDEKKTHLTASEIYHSAVKDMYEYCFKCDLAQVWAYLWSCWHTPTQWKLWAQSANEAIPHLKTTMIAESLWQNIKH